MDQPLKRAAAFGPLGPETAPERALRRVLAACHDDLLKHRRVVLASRRAEGVHQTRVALRRLRAAMALFRDAVAATEAREEMHVLARQAKWLAGECAPSRDLHVFLTETAADLPVMVRRVANRLARSHLQRSRDALASPRFDLFVSQLASFVDMPAPAATGRLDAFARQALAERHRRVLRRGRKLQSFDPERLHRLRIAIKKLRYAADFLRPAFPSRPTKAYIQATTRLQGALGTLNDREVAHRMIADLEAAARPTEDIARGLHRLAKRAASGDKRRRRKLERAWQKFRKIEPFWG